MILFLTLIENLKFEKNSGSFHIRKDGIARWCPIITLPDTECEDTRRLLGNNVLLYRVGNKIAFNHALWIEYVPPPAEPDYGSSDNDDSDDLTNGGARYFQDDY